MSKHKNKPTKEQREELQNIWKSDMSVIEAVEKRKEILGEQPLTLDEKKQLEQSQKQLEEALRYVSKKFNEFMKENRPRYNKVLKAVKAYCKKKGIILPPEYKDFFIKWFVIIRYPHLGLMPLLELFNTKIPVIEDYHFAEYGEYRAKVIKGRPEDKKFSVLEWATIFYYAYETKLLPGKGTAKSCLERFLDSHSITTTLNNITSKYYEAKRRINKKNDFPPNKLKKIIPFIEENYPQTVTKIMNDITYLKEQNTDY